MIKIDYSQLQTYITCPHQYYNRYVLGLRKIKMDERDVDRNFGKCIHKALELLYKGKQVKEAQEVFRNEYQGLESEKAKTPQNGEALIEQYWKYWHETISELSDNNLKTEAVEVIDSFKINADIEYLVKIDLIVKTNAGIWVIDHKTSSSIAYNYFYQFTPNMQVSGYTDYVQRKYGQCSGMIINLISVGYRQKAYKGQPAGLHCEFVRDIVNRNPYQIKDFEQNVISWVDRLHYSKYSSLYPKNESACHSFKGCGFKELCSSCDDEEIKNSLYEVYDAQEYLKGG